MRPLLCLFVAAAALASLAADGNRLAYLDGPLDPACSCAVCARHSRGYLRHLFAVGEPSAARLVSLHNVAWTVQLMDRIRAAIGSGTLAQVRRDVLNVWA